MFLNKVKKVLKNPSLINKKINSLLNKNLKKPNKIFTHSFSLDDQIKKIKTINFDNLLFVGNQNSFKHFQFSLNKKNITWSSSNFQDINLGAKVLSEIKLNNYDCFLVCSGNLTDDYRYILNNLNNKRKNPNVFWANGKFEFCGGTIPISKNCEDAEILIFNHFPFYFNIYDKLLVKVKIFNSKDIKSFNLILKPFETKCIRLSDFIDTIEETTCISHGCFHPRLTGGRHNRWRSTGLYYWKKSRAMVHSDHDFVQFNRPNEFKISLDLINDGEFNITLPNYEKNLIKDNSTIKILENNKINVRERSVLKKIDEIIYKKKKSEFDNGFFGVNYSGFGGSFWFGFEKSAKVKKKSSIMANHTSRSFLNNSDAIYKELDNDYKSFFNSIKNQGLMVTPFCLPFFIENVDLEFGFEFDSNSPPINSFLYKTFSKDGLFIKQGNFEKKNAGPLYTSDLIKKLKLKNIKNLGAIFISPDWIKMNLNAIGKGPVGQLILKNKKTNDKDVTEFQSCWRNNEIIINDFPHWLFQSKMLAGGSKLYCGFSGLNKNSSVYVSLLNGSGNINYSKKAEVNICLINHDGTILEKKVVINPFVCKLYNLDKIFPKFRKDFNCSFGTILVKSKNSDLNGNLITTSNGSVTLQHMWGY